MPRIAYAPVAARSTVVTSSPSPGVRPQRAEIVYRPLPSDWMAYHGAFWGPPMAAPRAAGSPWPIAPPVLVSTVCAGAAAKPRRRGNRGAALDGGQSRAPAASGADDRRQPPQRSAARPAGLAGPAWPPAAAPAWRPGPPGRPVPRAPRPRRRPGGRARAPWHAVGHQGAGLARVGEERDRLLGAPARIRWRAAVELRHRQLGQVREPVHRPGSRRRARAWRGRSRTELAAPAALADPARRLQARPEQRQRRRPGSRRARPPRTTAAAASHRLVGAPAPPRRTGRGRRGSPPADHDASAGRMRVATPPGGCHRGGDRVGGVRGHVGAARGPPAASATRSPASASMSDSSGASWRLWYARVVAHAPPPAGVPCPARVVQVRQPVRQPGP